MSSRSRTVSKGYPTGETWRDDIDDDERFKVEGSRVPVSLSVCSMVTAETKRVRQGR